MVRVVVQTLKILTIAVVALLVAAGGQRVLDYALDRSTAADAGRPVPFTVTQDDTGETMAARLHDAGLIRSEFVFETQYRLASGELVIGDHTLRKGMTVEHIIAEITGSAPGEPAEVAAEPGEFKITIPEGWRIEQIAEEAERLGLEGGYDAFMNATRSVDRSQYAFLADVPADVPIEGYLFPATYDIAANDPAAAVRRMLEEFDARVTPDMRTRAGQMGLTLHQVITLASLVEREAKLDRERAQIAAVYLNRLQAKMKLDADPTVLYALGQRGNWWDIELTGDLRQATDSPYNTYRDEMAGQLPPGPICNPSFDSIVAVLNPDDAATQNFYLYFVATGDEEGSHLFAPTLEEQNANIQQLESGGGDDGG